MAMFAAVLAKSPKRSSPKKSSPNLDDDPYKSLLSDMSRKRSLSDLFCHKICTFNFRKRCPLLSIFILYTLLTSLFAFLGGILFHLAEFDNEQIQILRKRALYNEIYEYLPEGHQQSLELLLNMCDIPMDLEENRWTLEKSTFFSFTTATTIGYGYVTPATTMGKIYTFLYGLPAVVIFGLSMIQIGHGIVEQIDRGRRSGIIKNTRCLSGCSEELKKTLFAFFLLLLVIGISSWLLTLTEEHWTFYDGAYFLWISISTIGYGDLQPTVIESAFWANWLIWLGLSITAILIGASQDYFQMKIESWRNEMFERQRLKLIDQIKIKNLKKRVSNKKSPKSIKPLNISSDASDLLKISTNDT